MRVLFALSLGLFACGNGSHTVIIPNSETPQTTVQAACINVVESACCNSPGEVQTCQYHESSGSYVSCFPGSITCLPSKVWGACEPTVNPPDAQSVSDSAADAIASDAQDGDGADGAEAYTQ
jgi:hypothetical protein